MIKISPLHNKKASLVLGLLFIAFWGNAQQAPTSPQVNFLQRTAASTPTQTVYNVKGDFTMLGNTNLTLSTYSTTTNNEGRAMKYVDIDGDVNTWNSSMASLELSNSGENGANPNCSSVLFAGLYWTGKSDDADAFDVSKQVQSGTQTINNNYTVDHSQSITNTNYTLNVTRANPNPNNTNTSPIYTFSGNSNNYVFNYTNTSTVTLSVNGGMATNIPVNITTSTGIATATLTTPYVITDGTVNLTINKLIRSTATNLNNQDTQSTSSALVNVSGTIPAYITLTKNYAKKIISLKGPGASTYTSITAKTNGTDSEILFPGSSHSGIFIGYQEVTDYVKTHGPGAYTVADMALTEGTNSNPGLSGGWVMVVIYENPVMKSRAVTLFDGYAYVNGQLRAASPYTTQGEYGTIPISGFTTAGSGDVNMKLGVMAAEGDVAATTGSDYLAVQKLNANPTDYPASYLTLNHAGNSTTNFFNSSIYPVPSAGTSNPILQNNTGVDFSMFTIPNSGNAVIGNNQTSTTFRFGSTYEVYTIFGFAMSVDAYIPEPKGLTSVTSINNVPNPAILIASPGQTINYSLKITNEGTEATNNTLITIPIPATAIFSTGATITHNLYHGFNPGTIPVYDSVANTITWNLGTLPITAGHPEYIYADLSFTLNVTTDCAIILSAGCNPEVSLETGTITGTGATSGSSFTKYFFQGYDTSICHLPISGAIKVAIDASSCLSSMAGPDQIASCGGENVTLGASTAKTGVWSIVSSPPGGGEIFSDITNPTSSFYSPNLGSYTLRWTTSCSTTDEVIVTFVLCNVVNFDGVDDHINFKNNHNLNSGNFSIEVWIKSNAANGNTQTIISKHLSPTSTDGYDLRLVNNLISFNWNNTSIIAAHAINTDRWYHVAVTFDGANYKLYIDGILDKTAAGTNPTLNSVDFILGAMSQNTNTPYNYYNGYADELRIWKVSLTVDQVRQMMNQEITNDGSGNVKGVIVPKNINGLSWNNLSGYYQMNRASDINNGYLVDKSGNSKNGKLKGIYIQEPDTAPLPYTSETNGNWETDATWTNYPVWDVPNSVGVDGTKIDWNIVKTSHNIISNGNKTILGLLVNSNTLSASNDSKIEVSSYLKLDGKIDLAGKSQLLQTAESDLDVTSSGSIERDQQGQSNLYNYNYWSSPVSPINSVSNNTDYTVNGVMNDGFNAIPRNINWISGYDGALGNIGTPVSLARYWLYKFDSNTDAYANWVHFTETDPLKVGLGYTLKGAGAIGADTLNYTFVGKPNNGTIANIIGADQLLLVGNPYPSAIDAFKFLDDNVSTVNRSTTDGTLYFWQHAPENNTHVLANYLGSYGVLNYAGGISGVTPELISGAGTAGKIPNQCIPVGQGFFVYGSPSGGSVQFKNSQRVFVKEDNTSLTGSNPMFKTRSNAKTAATNNSDDIIPVTNYKKIRLGYNTNNQYHRQVLLAFMEDRATSEIDYGYDAESLDDIPNDMYFLVGENQLVIQGVGFFDANTSYPIGIKADAEGKVSFVIDALENFAPEQAIFIHDNLSDTYHNIRGQAYEVVLPAGTNETRFSLRFTDKTLKVEQNSVSDIQIRHIQNGNTLIIINKLLDVNVEKVTLFNILGQSINTWKIENQEQQNIQIPIKNVSPGVYIAKLKTSEGGEISEKVIVFDD